MPVTVSLSRRGENSEPVDFDAVLSAARWGRWCAWCGEDLPWETVPSRAFCCDRHRYRFRDRRRYLENPERERQKSRDYYAANREKVIERVRRRRAGGK